VSAIASGSVGGAAAAIEGALSAALPVAISFLANLLGLGGISEKIKSIIGKVRAPVEKAVDWVIGKAVAGLKKVGGLFTGKGKGQGSDPSKDAAKGTAPGTDTRTPEQKQQDLKAGLAAANTLVQNEHLKDNDIKKQLPGIKAKYQMTALTLVVNKFDEAAGKETIHVHGEVNPSADTPTKEKSGVGLADRGYRPQPGERSMNRAKWKKQDGQARAGRQITRSDRPLRGVYTHGPQAGQPRMGHPTKHRASVTDQDLRTRRNVPVDSKFASDAVQRRVMETLKREAIIAAQGGPHPPSGSRCIRLNIRFEHNNALTAV
ncbi:MAG: hypothetical protein M3Z04_16590, partial [Chloroflexota bacterium]|nr:hypothetical protein [Chloroflexota bacterium]